MVWANPIQRHKRKKKVGKGLGGRKETVYTHDASFLMLVGERRSFSSNIIVEKVWLNSTLFYDHTGTDTNLNEYALDYMTIYDGNAGQFQESTMVSRDGAAKTPAYRGYITLFFKNLPLDNEKQSYNATYPTVEVLVRDTSGDRIDKLVFDYAKERANVEIELGESVIDLPSNEVNNPVKGFIFSQDGKSSRDYLEQVLSLSQSFLVPISYQNTSPTLENATKLKQVSKSRLKRELSRDQLGFGSEPKELVSVEAYDPEDLASELTLSYRTLDDQKTSEVSVELPSRQQWNDLLVTGFYSGNSESVSLEAALDHTFAKNTAAYLLNQKSNRKNTYILETDLEGIDGITAGSLLTHTYNGLSYDWEVVELTINGDNTASLKVSPFVGRGTLIVGEPEYLPPLIPTPPTAVSVVLLNTRKISSSDPEFSPKLIYKASSEIVFGELYASFSNNLPDYQLIDDFSGTSETGIVTSQTLNLAADPGIVDEGSTLTILMSYGELETLTPTQFYSESNILYLRGELIGFRDVVATAANTYQVSGLIRGMYGTQSKINAAIATNEPVYILKGLTTFYHTLSTLTLSSIGTQGYFKALESGTSLDLAATTNFTYTGEDARPAPPNLITNRQSNGDVQLIISPASRQYFNSFLEPVSYPINDDTHQYEVKVKVGSVVKRTEVTSSITYTYQNSDRLADGIADYNFYFEVRDYNPTYNLYSEAVSMGA